MRFTKSEVYGQRNKVAGLERRMDQVAKELNEKYKEHQAIAHELALARTELNRMED